MKSIISKLVAVGAVSTIVVASGVHMKRGNDLENTYNRVLLSKSINNTYSASIIVRNQFTKEYIPKGTKLSYICNGVSYNGTVGDYGKIIFKINLKSKFIFISELKIQGFKNIYNIDGMVLNNVLNLFKTNYSTMPSKSEYNSINFIPYIEGVKGFPVTKIKVMDNDWQTFTVKKGENGVFTADLGREYPSNTIVQFMVPGMNIYTYTVGQLQNNYKVRFYGNEFNLKNYMASLGNDGLRMMNTIQRGTNEVSIEPVKNESVVLSVYGERKKAYTNNEGYVELKENLMVTPYSDYSVLIQPPKDLAEEAIEDSHIGLAKYTFGLPVVPINLNNSKDNYFKNRVDMFSHVHIQCLLERTRKRYYFFLYYYLILYYFHCYYGKLKRLDFLF